MNGNQRIIFHLLDNTAQVCLYVVTFKIPAHLMEQAAKSSLAFNQVNTIALLRQRKRRCHAGDPSANNQCSMIHADGVLADGFQQPGFCYIHVCDFNRFGSSKLLIVLVTPGALLTDICKFKEEFVQPYLADGILEKGGMGTRST